MSLITNIILTMRFAIWIIAILVSPVLRAQVSISTSGAFPDPSAGLDINFNNKGLLLPRMSSAERDQIDSPAHSLMIYNTTTFCIEAYNEITGEWVCMSFLGCLVPGVATSSAASDVAQTQFTANWTAGSNAESYLLDVSTSPVFATFLPGLNSYNVGNVTSYDVTGLTCGTTYYYRVRALNSCSTSSFSGIISVATVSCCIPQAISAGATTTGTVSGGMSITIAKPSGVVSGNLLIACITTNGGFASAPSGWTLIANSSGGNCGSSTFYRVAGGSEPANYSFPFGGSTYSSGVITRFIGTDAVSPIMASSVIETSGYTPTPVTTTDPNAMLVFAVSSGNGGNTWTSPGGYSAGYSGGLNVTSTGIFYRIQSAAGQSDAVSAPSAVGDTGNAHLIALRPGCQ